MIFSELYSAYYNAVAGLLKIAVKRRLAADEFRDIVKKNAFGESILNIEPALREQRWQLIHADGTTPLKHIPTMPLTTLEKRWLKAIYEDPRIKLFSDDKMDLGDIEPLFKAEDIFGFDKYSDGDPYENEIYIRNFRLILDAIKNHYPLNIAIKNRINTITHMIVLPDHLEYSEKDDKFRLIGFGRRRGNIVNLARIVNCEPYKMPYKINHDKKLQTETRQVEFELYDKRNALERVLLHFAHFEKRAEKIADNQYKITISYEKNDETEIVIRILSFGPMLKVTAPEHFIELIKERLISQKNCEC